MTLNILKINPGVVKDITPYSAGKSGPFWIDSDKVRFKNGFATKIGGWEKQTYYSIDSTGTADYNTEATINGTARVVRNWRSISDLQDYMAIATSDHLYILLNDALHDITPLRKTSSSLSNPITTVDSSSIVTITDTTHGASVGDWVCLTSATGFNGIATDTFNNPYGYQILTVPTANTYTIDVGTAASGAGAGGGTMNVEYLVSEGLGLSSGTGALGWGAGTWGGGTWGTPRTATVEIELSMWSLNLWGEDLVATVRGYDIYYWDLSAGTNNRAVLVSSLGGAASVPANNRMSIISFPDRHLIAAGTVPYGGSTIDPMLVRWSDQEDFADWAPTATNTSGDQRLEIGTKINAIISTREETFISTDEAVYGMTFIGPPFTFSFRLIGTNCGAIGPNAMQNVDSTLFWMGRNEFYFYNGNIAEMPCPVKHYVFNRLNKTQDDKIFAGQNSEFNEVCWFYVSNENTDLNPEPDSYVCYNYMDKVWTVGSIDRVTWNDSFGIKTVPFAFDKDGVLYNHETGDDANGVAMNSYIESSALEISPGGDNTFMVDKVIPDLTAVGDISLTVKTRKYPNSSDITKGPFTMNQTTEKVSLRAKGRQMSFKIQSSNLGDSWILGDFRINSIKDGLR